MRRFIWMALIVVIAQPVFAQRPGAVSGKLMDTVLHQPVVNASITLLRLKDSTLVTYGLTTDKGTFGLYRIPQGTYYLSISHVRYHPLQVPITITGNGASVDVGMLVMHSKTDTLGEVTVKAVAPPISMVGDTLQYNAPSFKVRPNSNVEDLLKKLPGVEVMKDGTVKVLGEVVKDVLVDGKQFFGHDPKVATRNLQADWVDKVQVYDRLSDEAQLTGFNDGNSHKTINLKLKDDKKKGAFGMLRAGEGTLGRWAGKGNINVFTNNFQVSVIGQGNNVNSDGEDYGAVGGNGLTTLWNGGVNFNSSLNKHTDFEGFYQYNNTTPLVSEQTKRQYLLNDSSYLYNESSKSSSVNNSHQVQATIEITPDSTSSLKILPSLGIQRNRQSTGSMYGQEGEDGRLSNEGTNNSQSMNNGYDFSNEILYRKKLGHAGRTFSFSLLTMFSGLHEDDQQSSFNTLYDKDGNRIASAIDTLLQQGNNSSSNYNITAKAIYTEPLWRSSLLAFSLEQNNSRSNNQRTVFNYNGVSGKYDLPDTMQSNSFSSKDISTNAGIQLLTQRKKFRYDLGLTLQRHTLLGSVDSIPGKTFMSLLVKGGIRYNFSNVRYLSFNYQTRTGSPTLAQLQPVQRFSNPMYIEEGNPDLRQEYTHSEQISYTSTKPARGKSFNASLSASQFMHRILMTERIDSIGVQYSRPVNVAGCSSLDADMGFGFPVDALRLTMNLSVQGSYNRGKQIVNSLQSNVDIFSGGPGFHLQWNPLEVLNVSMTARLDMNTTRYALQTGSATSWSSQFYESSVSWQLPADFFFGTDLIYSVNNGALGGTNTRVPLWNAFISVRFLHSQRAEIKLTVHDILDENVQVSNSSSAVYIENRQVLSLRRFAMLTFLYNIQGISIK